MLKATPENLVGKPQVSFKKGEFDAAIWKHGYYIQIEKAHRCPCEGTDGISKFNCQNCHGTGYFWINPIETVGLITGVNKNTEYKDWSIELIGTIALSVRDNNNNDWEKVSFYDKITLISRSETQIKPFAYYTEVLRIRTDNVGNYFVFLTYKPQEVISIFKFVSESEPLERITDFTQNEDNEYVIDLNGIVCGVNGVISVRYKADIQYIVLDLPHEVRHTTKKGTGNRIESQSMPIQAICRRTHLTQVERKNYDGTGIQDNSYTV
jgi:hypothetical protein